MAELPPLPESAPVSAAGRGARLDSWKEIAAYVRRDARTLQRWEKTAGFPVRRIQKPGLRAVYAYTADLDQWLLGQSGLAGDGEPGVVSGDGLAPPPVPEAPAARHRWRVGLAVLAAVTVATAAAVALRPRTPEPLGPFTVRPITSEAGNERDPDISPDGKYIAYAYQAPNLRTRIAVRLIRGGRAALPHRRSDGCMEPGVVARRRPSRLSARRPGRDGHAAAQLAARRQ